LDGGFSYAARRSAQNAADAGALAGANILCEAAGGDAYAAAWDYAVTRNGALNADIDVGTKMITVTATIPHQSFFAGMIGSDVVTTTATAAAGCFAPCNSETVMPVAWACHPPVGGDPNADCEIEYGTLDEPGPLYMIMDDEKADEDYQCQYPPNSGEPAGTLDCDLDDDGVNDMMGGGGRSWLNLNGGPANTPELRDWIENGSSFEIPVHIWLPGGVAVNTDVFRSAETRVGDIVIVPVFNDFTSECDPQPIGETCHNQWHSGVDTENPSDGSSKDYYHVITFSAFRITGVSTGNNKCKHIPGMNCDAKQWLIDEEVLTKSAKTIEGYFVEGYIPGLGGKCDYDAGAYTIYLDH
jgi:hypothetical protein